MKTAIIMADGIKQIMFTPENENEKQALELFTPNEEITLEVKTGTLFDRSPDSAKGYTVQKCKGDYLRAYEDEDSLMFILKPKKLKSNN